MKFLNFNLFRAAETIEDVVRYLAIDLANSLRDLNTGLTRLRLTENFEGFEATVSFSGAGEIAIRHNAGFVPSQRIILRATVADLIDGPTEWSKDYVYISKTGAGTGTATILFLK